MLQILSHSSPPHAPTRTRPQAGTIRSTSPAKGWTWATSLNSVAMVVKRLGADRGVNRHSTTTPSTHRRYAFPSTRVSPTHPEDGEVGGGSVLGGGVVWPGVAGAGGLGVGGGVRGAEGGDGAEDDGQPQDDEEDEREAHGGGGWRRLRRKGSTRKPSATQPRVTGCKSKMQNKMPNYSFTCNVREMTSGIRVPKIPCLGVWQVRALGGSRAASKVGEGLTPHPMD